MGGDFCHSEGKRDQLKDQGGGKQKDQEGSSCMDVRQNAFYVPNNVGVY